MLKIADILVKALDAGDVALSAERANLYPPFDPEKPDEPRKPLRVDLETGRGKRTAPCFELAERPSGGLVVTGRGDAALRWLHTLALEDAAVQVERAAAKRAAAGAAIEPQVAAALLGPAAAAAVRAAGETSKPGEATVTVFLTPPGPPVPVDIDHDFIEPPTPPATPAAKKKRHK